MHEPPDTFEVVARKVVERLRDEAVHGPSVAERIELVAAILREAFTQESKQDSG